MGDPYEIFRGAPVYEKFYDSELELAKKDGSWSSEDSDIRFLINLWLKGDFDEENDEISEENAMVYLAQWRAGYWPDEAYHVNDKVRLRGPIARAKIIGSRSSVDIDRGSIGTIVSARGDPMNPRAYDVKFYIKDQNCYAVATISAYTGDIGDYPAASPLPE
jgi:hypothetical protein